MSFGDGVMFVWDTGDEGPGKLQQDWLDGKCTIGGMAEAGWFKKGNLDNNPNHPIFSRRPV